MNCGSIDERGQEERRWSEERFELLVRSVKDYALFMLDPEGRVVSWNEGAERIKGYPANEILGKSFTTFYPKEAIELGFPQSELEVASREGRFEDEGWRVRKDGSLFWANVIITAMRNPDGQLLGFAKVTRDLTVRREAEEQARRLAAEQAARVEAARRGEELAHLNDRLRQQAVELQVALAATKAARDDAERAAAAATEAYRELDQFAYVASHDLKAPLRGIANLAQWLRDDIGEQLKGDFERAHAPPPGPRAPDGSIDRRYSYLLTCGPQTCAARAGGDRRACPGCHRTPRAARGGEDTDARPVPDHRGGTRARCSRSS